MYVVTVDGEDTFVTTDSNLALYDVFLGVNQP
jgi:hypothetical protein